MRDHDPINREHINGGIPISAYMKCVSPIQRESLTLEESMERLSNHISRQRLNLVKQQMKSLEGKVDHMSYIYFASDPRIIYSVTKFEPLGIIAHLPQKSACTTVYSSLLKASGMLEEARSFDKFGDGWVHHFREKIHRNLSPIRYQDLYSNKYNKIMFIRNPAERFISWLNHFIKIADTKDYSCDSAMELNSILEVLSVNKIADFYKLA